ncbi:MAG: Maf family protein [Gammaproteobacteria bacterium]|nr:Maf family protein [Gammaproteobacteria bacterium]
MSRLVLASSSAYRAALLSRLSLKFKTASPNVDESQRAGESAAVLVARLARAKAWAVALDYPDGLIIGSDQAAVVMTGDTAVILGKPHTAERAHAQLLALSGQRVKFLTSVCLLNAATHALQLDVVETPVTFRQLTRPEIERYVELEQPLDCAGAFKSEGLGIALFESLGGDDPNALIGLPLIALCTMLRAEGVSVLA